MILSRRWLKKNITLLIHLNNPPLEPKYKRDFSIKIVQMKVWWWVFSLWFWLAMSAVICVWSCSHFGLSTPFCDFGLLPLWKLLACKWPAACLDESALPEELMTGFNSFEEKACIKMIDEIGMAFEMSVLDKLIQWKSLNSEKHCQNVNYKHCHRSIKHRGVEKTVYVTATILVTEKLPVLCVIRAALSVKTC